MQLKDKLVVKILTTWQPIVQLQTNEEKKSKQVDSGNLKPQENINSLDIS